MTEPTRATSQRSYGCTFGCGNPYDYVVISVADGTTYFLCLPCYVRLATDMVEAVVDPNGLKILAAMAADNVPESAPMRDGGPRKRGHNAPVTTEDDDLFEAFSSVVTEDELPDEFK
jgi:hypothetical protein